MGRENFRLTMFMTVNGSFLFCFVLFSSGPFFHLRSALHLEGAHSLEAELHHVAALGSELMATALEALLIEDNDLSGKNVGHVETADDRL